MHWELPVGAFSFLHTFRPGEEALQGHELDANTNIDKLTRQGRPPVQRNRKHWAEVVATTFSAGGLCGLGQRFRTRALSQRHRGELDRETDDWLR